MGKIYIIERNEHVKSYKIVCDDSKYCFSQMTTKLPKIAIYSRMHSYGHLTQSTSLLYTRFENKCEESEGFLIIS